MKALLFGGAFNPMTEAHLYLPDEVRKSFGYDKVIYMPSKSKYILETEKKGFSYSEEERLDMLEQVALYHSWMIVSDYEIRQKEQNRTYFTLKYLKEKGYEPTLLIGSDWLIGLEEKWMYIDEILAEFGIIVMKRNNDDIDAILNSTEFLKERKDKFKIAEVSNDYQSVSSSQIRKLIQRHRWFDVMNLVPMEVYAWIKENEKK